MTNTPVPEPAAGLPPETPEFSRPVTLSRLNRHADHVVSETATEAERADVARLLGLLALPKLRIEGRLRPTSGDGWQFRGSLGASVVQACVVSLAPVKARIDQGINRVWLPDAVASALDAEIELSEADIDGADPLPRVLDLGLLAIEELALALPDYPRAPDAVSPGTGDAMPLAEARPEGAAPIGEAEKPFAGLAALRDSMDKDTE